MTAILAMLTTERLVKLAPVDLAIVVFYFVLVLGIGFYLKRFAKTGEDFFMAGREMTAWVAGLAFVSANLGSLELLGWAGSAYQYGILAGHWYWIGAIPAMLFLGLVMMPFYYISKTHSVPGYLQLRYGTAASGLSAVTFAIMTILMSGVNMYAMAVVMKVVLGWNLNFSIFVSSITVAIYVAAGGLFSAIFNEVLQFFLIWFGALLIPILGLIETGGWKGWSREFSTTSPARISRICGATSDTFRIIRWACTGRASSSASARCRRWVIGRPIFSWFSAYFQPRTSVLQRWRRSSAPSLRWPYLSSSYSQDCWRWPCFRCTWCLRANFNRDSSATTKCSRSCSLATADLVCSGLESLR